MKSIAGHMSPGCVKVVRPSGTGLETRLVLMVALLTVLICGGSILLRNTSSAIRETPDWQIDAFKDLRTEELATFNGLYTAAPEIELFHEDVGSRWPTVDELESDFIPPFVQDVAWEQNGSIEWTHSIISTSSKHIALYVGHPRQEALSGSFLLVMLHDHVKKEGNAGAISHAPYEIWLHVSPAADIPSMVTDQALINKGWREVVARRGEDEMKRTKGEDYLQ